MDPITHAISGAVLARAIPKHHLPPLQLLFLVLLTMAPDADILLRLFSENLYLQHHRGLTHSLLMLPLWGWLIFSLSCRRIRQNPTMPWLVGAALLLHIMLDLITTFGTMILAPISDWRASLDLLFIIDPFFTASLLIPLLFGLIWHQHKRKMGILSLLLMSSYLGLTFSNQQQAIDLARKARPGALTYHALPMAFSPFHWQLIVSFPDHYLRAAVNLQPGFSGTQPLFDEVFATGLVSTAMGDPEHLQWQQLPSMQSVNDIDKLPGAAFYYWFARYPVVLTSNEQFIDIGDLAFGAGAPGVNASFLLHIDLNGSENGDGDATHTGKPSQPRAWLIWRNGNKSELTQRSRPFNWLP